MIIKHISHYSVKFEISKEYQTLNDVLIQLAKDGITEDNICLVRGDNGGTLLHEAIASMRIDLIEFFISKEIPINVVTADGYNELHLLAECVIYSCLSTEIDKFNRLAKIANTLLDRGIDLTQQDKKYKNIPLYSLLYAGVLRFDEGISLIKRCIDLNHDIYVKNRSGNSLIDYLNSRGEKGEIILDYCKSLGLLTESDLHSRQKTNHDSTPETVDTSGTPKETTVSPSEEDKGGKARYEKYRSRKIAEGKSPMDAESWLRRYGTKK